MILNRWRHTPLLFFAGWSSAVYQTMLLRELMVEVNGNELVFSVFLSIWLMGTAFGSLSFGFLKRFVEKKLYTLFILYLLLAPIQFLLVGPVSRSLSLVSGSTLSIPVLFFIALLILIPASFTGGILFPLRCSVETPHRVYLLESIGMFAGALFIYIFLPFLSNFSLLLLTGFLAFFVMASVCLLTSFHDKKEKAYCDAEGQSESRNIVGYMFQHLYTQPIRRIGSCSKFLIPAVVLLFLLFLSKEIFLAQYGKRYLPANLVETMDTPYGRFDVTDHSGNRSYFWNGLNFGGSSKIENSEEIVKFVLLQHEKPENLLFMGGLLSGYGELFLKDQRVDHLYYLGADRSITDESGLENGISMIRMDAVSFLRKSEEKFDLIFFDLPDPSSLQLNRFYTIEFFKRSIPD